MEPSIFEQVYASIVKKEPTYDGVYYTGVKTTRIVCRPSCRARTPKRENITLYPTLAAALRDGFRPCKRCKPETNGTLRPDAVMAAQIDAQIDARYGERLTLRILAAELAISPYHLQRTYKRVTGRSPMEKLHEVRLAEACRMLLGGGETKRAGLGTKGAGASAGIGLGTKGAGTPSGVGLGTLKAGTAKDLGVAEIARAVGFRSASHFAVWFREQTGMSPVQYRECGGSVEWSGQTEGRDEADV